MNNDFSYIKEIYESKINDFRSCGLDLNEEEMKNDLLREIEHNKHYSMSEYPKTIENLESELLTKVAKGAIPIEEVFGCSTDIELTEHMLARTVAEKERLENKARELEKLVDIGVYEYGLAYPIKNAPPEASEYVKPLMSKFIACMNVRKQELKKTI